MNPLPAAGRGIFSWYKGFFLANVKSAEDGSIFFKNALCNFYHKYREMRKTIVHFNILTSLFLFEVVTCLGNLYGVYLICKSQR